jgi:hypothetical protein
MCDEKMLVDGVRIWGWLEAEVKVCEVVLLASGDRYSLVASRMGMTAGQFGSGMMDSCKWWRLGTM